MAVRYQRAVDLVELTGILQTTVTGLSIDEISTRFEVSRRTAERMLSALRDRFPDLEPIFRAGRKYWKLPPSSRARPLQLPRTLDVLSERIVQLEAEVSASRSSADAAQAITDGVLADSHVGMIVVDSSHRVVLVNDALGLFLGQPVSELIGRDMRRLLQDRIQHVFHDPDRFARNVLATYQDNNYIENFECHVLEGGGRAERWLEYWSQPIPSGRYAGGRIDHYVDITHRLRDDESGEPHPRQGRLAGAPEHYPTRETAASEDPALPESVTPVLRNYLSTLQEAAGAALSSPGASPALLLRLTQVVHSMSQAIGHALDVLESGQAKPEPLAVPAVLETVAALLRTAANEKGIELSISAHDSMPLIEGDRALVITSLTGAARNSIAALPAGSRVELRAEVLCEPERVRISILDDGPGMPEAFGQFDRSFVPTRTGGLGLGIALIRDVQGTPAGITQYYEQLAYTPAG